MPVALQGMTDFSQLGLSAPTLQAVADTGYTVATPIQSEAIPVALAGRDVLGIAQHIVRIPSTDHAIKRLALRALVAAPDVKNGIVFCNRKSEVDVVAKSLKKHGFDASPIHGDLEQSQRTRTLDAFRRGELKVLVASDLAARGLDIPDVSHI